MRGITPFLGTHVGRSTRPFNDALKRSTSPAKHRVARGIFAALIMTVAVGWGAAPASAHNYIVESSPAAGDVVTEQPGVFSVTTNDLLLDLGGAGTGSAMLITGPTSAPLFYGDGCATVLGATIEAQAQLGQAGQYTVIWQTVSTDGHSISDEFTFNWTPAAGQILAAGAQSAPSCGTEADAAVTSAAPADAGAEASTGVGSAIAWIGGTLGAVVIAVGVTLFILRRTPRS